MKKIVFLSMLILLAVSGSALAGTIANSGDGTGTEGLSMYGGVDAADANSNSKVLLGKMSKGVIFSHYSVSTGYAVVTKHSSGTKEYGTAHDSTAIRFKDVGTGATIAGKPTQAGVAAFATGGWTTM